MKWNSGKNTNAYILQIALDRDLHYNILGGYKIGCIKICSGIWKFQVVPHKDFDHEAGNRPWLREWWHCHGRSFITRSGWNFRRCFVCGEQVKENSGSVSLLLYPYPAIAVCQMWLAP